MIKVVVGRVAAVIGRGTGTGTGGGTRRLLHLTGPGLCGDPGAKGTEAGLDPSILGYLVCPLSKKRLRYEESSSQLINDELGIAYPVVDGIPNMIPQDARLIRKSEDRPKEEESSQQ